MPRLPPASLTKGLEEDEIFRWMLLGAEHLRHPSLHTRQRKLRPLRQLQQCLWHVQWRAFDSFGRCSRPRTGPHKRPTGTRHGVVCAFVQVIERRESPIGQAERRCKGEKARLLRHTLARRTATGSSPLAHTHFEAAQGIGKTRDTGTNADAGSRQAKHETPVLLLLVGLSRA